MGKRKAKSSSLVFVEVTRKCTVTSQSLFAQLSHMAIAGADEVRKCSSWAAVHPAKLPVYCQKVERENGFSGRYLVASITETNNQKNYVD